MKRIVGLSSAAKKAAAEENKVDKVKPPERGIEDVVQDTDRKSNSFDSKAADCDAELRKITEKLKTTDSAISRQLLQQKAKTILIRKKRFEQQAESLREKSFNLESLASTLTSADDMRLVAGALKSGTKHMKKELKKIDLATIEDQQEELADLIDLTEEVQNALSKNYEIPEDIGDEELESQLELLGDEIVQDNDTSYIDEALRLPSSLSTNDNDNKPSTQTGGATGPTVGVSPTVDEFGLPILDTSTAANTNANHEDPNHLRKEAKN